MRSFDNHFVCALLLLLLGAGAGVRAQTEDAMALPEESDAIFRTASGARYASAYEQDQIVLNSPASAAEDFRLVVNRYWSFVRRYPSNGYTDNALWQAANLSAESFRRFGEDRDKHRAVQLLQWLRDQYPHSSLRKGASARIGELEAMASNAAASPEPVPAQTASAATAETEAPAAVPTTGTSSSVGTIRSIEREVLPEVVRVTVELDREVPFDQEQIDGPARLFFDLKSTRAVPALVDATFRYDADIIRHIRFGRHANRTTRIVLDIENVSRYSVFTLYNPFRIVIDAERRNATAVATRDVETPGTRAAIGTPSSSPAPVNKPDAKPAVAVAAQPSAKGAISEAVPAAETGSASADDKPVMAGRPVAPARNSSGKFSVARQLGLGVSRIVIDAGHGGKDPGASAHGVTEAELVLDVALRLETLLLQQPGMEVILTRRTNEFLPLEERTEIANDESADLFLSIHANASSRAAARGVETYFLNFALNPQAEAVAARENAASGKTMNSLPQIIKAITLNNKLNESRDFASSIQRALVRGMRPGNKSLRDLGVKQAPFMVLIGAAMPSVLAEISFVTNRQEARLLKTAAYRQRIAESLLAGILRYQEALKKVQTAALQ
jgi:N-acetylmuramoyl-L-alanine amidase